MLAVHRGLQSRQAYEERNLQQQIDKAREETEQVLVTVPVPIGCLRVAHLKRNSYRETTKG